MRWCGGKALSIRKSPPVLKVQPHSASSLLARPSIEWLRSTGSQKTNASRSGEPDHRRLLGCAVRERSVQAVPGGEQRSGVPSEQDRDLDADDRDLQRAERYGQEEL